MNMSKDFVARLLPLNSTDEFAVINTYFVNGVRIPKEERESRKERRVATALLTGGLYFLARKCTEKLGSLFLWVKGGYERAGEEVVLFNRFIQPNNYFFFLYQ